FFFFFFSFVIFFFFFFFFFSSRRRHTRSYGDWSSDVCSSDLVTRGSLRILKIAPPFSLAFSRSACRRSASEYMVRNLRHGNGSRSEERRVGKEGRCRGSAEH